MLEIWIHELLRGSLRMSFASMELYEGKKTCVVEVELSCFV